MQHSGKPHPFSWIVEELELHPSYLERSMFGSRAAYVHGRLQLILSAQGEEPWNGLMIATERTSHESLTNDFPALVSHPILGKWLYLSQKDEDFERICTELATLVRKNDPRIGVIPKPRKSRRRKSSPKSFNPRVHGRITKSPETL